MVRPVDVLPALLALPALAGCAQLFGLDETTGRAPPAATLELERVSIGARVVTAPLELGSLSATYLVADAAEPTGLARIPGAVSGPGTWSAERDEPTPILFTLPDTPTPIPRLVDFPSLALKLTYGVLEHPSPTPAPDGATLQVSVNLDAPYVAGQTLQLFALGPWARRTLEAPAAGATSVVSPVFPYTEMVPLTARPLERVTADDQLVVLRYATNQLIGAARLGGFDQTGTDALTGDMITVPLAPLDMQIDPAGAAARFAAVRPQTPNIVMQWTVRAAPGGILNNDQGPLLNAAGVTPTDPPSTVTATYGNPFADLGWTTTALWLTEAQRTYTPPSAGLPVTLRAGMHQRAEPGPGLAMTLAAGLPELISLDGMSLSTDGLSIPLPTRAVEISFVTGTPDHTMYQAQLYKLVPNAAGTALQYQVVLSALGVAPRFVVPPELFEPGALYTIRAFAIQGGFPSIATGDLSDRSLPISISYLDSGVFQVAP